MLSFAPMLASEPAALLVFGVMVRLAADGWIGARRRRSVARMSAGPAPGALSTRHLPVMSTTGLEGAAQ